MNYQPNVPWRFEINRKHRHMRLIDSRHNTVIDFARYGMQHGQARFNVRNILTDAKDLAIPLPGRDHHADWCAGIDHPDARLIEAAPGLLHAVTHGAELNLPDFLEWIAARLVNVHGDDRNADFVLTLYDRAKVLRAAISKVDKP